MAVVSSSSTTTGTVVRLVLIIAAAVILFALVTYYNSTRSERFSTAVGDAAASSPLLGPLRGGPVVGAPPQSASALGGAPYTPSPAAPANVGTLARSFAPVPAGPKAAEPMGNEKFLPVGMNDPSVGMQPIDPFPQDRITPDQLLPKDAANSKWAQANPAGQGDVKDQNFLTAGYHLGFDTQGTSLRNASHDLRSSPANPRLRVSIWQQSTIEPDLGRRPIEI